MGSDVVLNWLPRLRRNSNLHADGFGKGLMKIVFSIQQGETTTSQMGIVSQRKE